ncbi:leukotriene B4 receptor 2b [Nothobranchius furzeri]|uniref:Leukotriene B4 receptor 1-like n=2 Tax=Nothobranchius furzeri TaxID=105023 RepID=A0A8C6VXV1_NOTFU|nr:leukotriene B4 receptor 2b [Nothobranchius furzeri]KAF7222005.1 leukotriene B4 receptor 1-like [Nothobranchius furzeri]
MTSTSLSFLTEPTTSPVEEESAVSNDYSTTVGALILSLVFLLGLPGNLFVIWSIMGCIRKRSVTAILILNLACADGFLMALTIFFIIYLGKRTWIFGNGMCKIMFYLCNANMYASIFLITLMSMHRMVAVVHPHKLHMITRAIMKRVILCMWVLVMVISVPSLVFRDVIIKHDKMNKTVDVCMPNHTKPSHARFQYTLETVSAFIIPYAIIIFCYVLILRRLRQTHFHHKVRSEKLILAIVTTFGIFWLPYHFINMVEVTAKWYPRDSKTRAILDNIHTSSRAVTSALAFISSCANPILYTFAGKSYIKKNGFAFMAKLFEGTSSEQLRNTKSQTEIEYNGRL